MSAKDRIRDFFLEHVGEVVTTQQIRDVAGISEYARRIRELRDEEGMQILSHRDRDDLRPGEYVLVSEKRVPRIARGISLELRNRILERNGFTCQHCGLAAGDENPCQPGRTVTLQIDHIVPISQGGSNDESNLRVLCSLCNEPRSNVQPASESAINLLARIRRAPRSVQKEVFKALALRFQGGSEE